MKDKKKKKTESRRQEEDDLKIGKRRGEEKEHKSQI